MWPIASMVGAPCWPLKYMMSDAHETRLPGAWPKISWVILCVLLSANENGGFSERIGACSFQTNERSNTRAALTARIRSSAEPRGCAAAGPPVAARSAVSPAVPSHCRRDVSLMTR